jgi:hypothetical protein
MCQSGFFGRLPYIFQKMTGIRGGRKRGEIPLLIRACVAFQVGVDNFLFQGDFLLKGM